MALTRLTSLNNCFFYLLWATMKQKFWLFSWEMLWSASTKCWKPKMKVCIVLKFSLLISYWWSFLKASKTCCCVFAVYTVYIYPVGRVFFQQRDPIEMRLTMQLDVYFFSFSIFVFHWMVLTSSFHCPHFFNITGSLYSKWVFTRFMKLGAFFRQSETDTKSRKLHW